VSLPRADLELLARHGIPVGLDGRAHDPVSSYWLHASEVAARLRKDGAR